MSNKKFAKVKKTYRIPAPLVEAMSDAAVERMKTETELLIEAARFWLREFHPTRYSLMLEQMGIGKEKTADEKN